MEFHHFKKTSVIWTNKSNLKQYVGSSLNLGKRFAWYYLPSVLKGETAQKRISFIARALHKIGHDNFTLQPEYNIRPAESSVGYTRERKRC
jgi:hypothetical protein